MVGIDVGFSKSRASTGIAWFDDSGTVHVGHATSSWEDRRQHLGDGSFDLVAIDAPHTTAPADQYRSCERVFNKGLFQRRCKPACSHVRGTGRELRAAGRETADQIRTRIRESPLGFPRIGDANIVEAFPNTFLGVCLDHQVYLGMPPLKRGKKFDALYEEWISGHLFRAFGEDLDVESSLLDRCESNRHHDERAALICLLTAVGVHRGRYTAVGEAETGYFFLPPRPHWASWAREELDQLRTLLPSLEIWVDGEIVRA